MFCWGGLKRSVSSAMVLSSSDMMNLTEVVKDDDIELANTFSKTIIGSKELGDDEDSSYEMAYNYEDISNDERNENSIGKGKKG